MNYAYQHAFGDIWNDFDHPKYRDHVFAYPVSNGLISTVQWEGFREAADDIRYLTAALSMKDQPESEWHDAIYSSVKIGLPPPMIRRTLIQQIIGN